MNLRVEKLLQRVENNKAGGGNCIISLVPSHDSRQSLIQYELDFFLARFTRFKNGL